jgi:hypothetical protein
MTPPEDATGEYQDYNGVTTWVKDIDLKQSNYPVGRIWSLTTKRWRLKRELIRVDRVRLFAVPRETE